MAKCIECGCTEMAACEGGCSWIWVNPEEGTGLCSACAGKKGYPDFHGLLTNPDYLQREMREAALNDPTFYAVSVYGERSQLEFEFLAPALAVLLSHEKRAAWDTAVRALSQHRALVIPDKSGGAVDLVDDARKLREEVSILRARDAEQKRKIEHQREAIRKLEHGRTCRAGELKKAQAELVKLHEVARAADALRAKIDEVPIDLKLGDETDRVFARWEFDELRAALAKVDKPVEPLKGGA